MHRSINLLANVTGDTGTGNEYPLSVPSWADAIVIHVRVSAVTGSAPSFDAAVYQANPDGSGTDIAVTGAGLDALTAAGNAFIALGPRVGSVAGTGYDAVPAALSRSMNLVTTMVSTDETYDYKIWVEYIGYGKR